MQLTFRGFLWQYCAELGGTGTRSLSRLCRLAATDAPRLAEPLACVAAVQGDLPRLCRLARGTWLESLYEEVLEASAGFDDFSAYLQDGGTPERLRKVWRAYAARKGRVGDDRRIAGIMAPLIIEGLRARGVTCYRMAKDLGVNQGNAYAYLHGGDSSKVSRATARRMLEYATRPAADNSDA